MKTNFYKIWKILKIAERIYRKKNIKQIKTLISDRV